MKYVVPLYWKQQNHDRSSFFVSTVPPILRGCTENIQRNDPTTATRYGQRENGKKIGSTSLKENCGEPAVNDENDHPASPLESDTESGDDFELPSKKAVLTKNNDFKCPYCDSMFPRKFTLKCHTHNKHSNELSDSNCHCHDCGFKCHKIVELQKHLARTHNILFRSEQILLENING